MSKAHINTIILHFGGGKYELMASVICSVLDRGIYFESDAQAIDELCKDILAIYKEKYCVYKDKRDCCVANFGDNYCKNCGTNLTDKFDVNAFYNFICDMTTMPGISYDGDVCDERDIVWNIGVSPKEMLLIKEKNIIEIFDCQKEILKHLNLDYV